MDELLGGIAVGVFYVIYMVAKGIATGIAALIDLLVDDHPWWAVLAIVGVFALILFGTTVSSSDSGSSAKAANQKNAAETRAETANAGTHVYRLTSVKTAQVCTPHAKVGDTWIDRVTFSPDGVSLWLNVIPHQSATPDALGLDPTSHYRVQGDTQYGLVERSINFTASGFTTTIMLNGELCSHYSWRIVSSSSV